MAYQSYLLNFDGYWRESNWGGLPAESGIYCVYACTYDARKKTVWLNRLLYIGESKNVRDRIPEDPKDRRDKWTNELERGEVLCASCAKISPVGARIRAEAAMIYYHKPPCNVEYIYSFSFDKTRVETSGENILLSGSFTVV